MTKLFDSALSHSLDRRTFLGGMASLAGASSLSMPAIAQQRKKVLVSEAFHVSLGVPLFTAVRKGFFVKHGLDVEVATAGGAQLPVPVLLSEQGQIAFAGPSIAINSTYEGGKMRCFAKGAGGAGLYAVAKPGTKIASISDMRDMTIATLRYPSNTITTPTFLMRTQGGFEPEARGVEFRELPPGAQAAAVKEGRADLAVLFEWDASAAVHQLGLEKVFSFAEAVGPLAFSVFFCTEKYFQENPDIIQGFCNGLAEAMKLLHASPDVFQEISLAEFPQVPPAAIEGGSKSLMNTPYVVPRNPVIAQTDWEAITRHESSAGILRHEYSYDEIVDSQLASKASTEFGLHQ